GRQQGQDTLFRVAKPTAPPRPKLVSTEKTPDENSSTWIDFNSLASGESRKAVRAQAARASAAARRATLAKKQARQGPHLGSLIFALPTTAVTRKAVASKALLDDVVHRVQDQSALRNASAADRVYFHHLVDIVTEFLENRPLSLTQSGETSLAHNSIRSTLWDAMTTSTTLFQVAIFMAGTHSNTCGLPKSAFAHMGPGLITLRGASIDAIQANLTGDDAESIAPIAIALLAGWESRYGDSESYEVHMRAWQTLAISGKSLEEQNVATLTDLTLEMYRLGLDEQSTRSPSGISIPVSSMSRLPPGFRAFPMTRAETRSLLAIAAQLAQHHPRSKGEIIRLRRLALENMAWSPTHTRSYEPLPDVEEQYGPLELNALYHIRAVHISICGVILQHTMDMHDVRWSGSFDLRGGLMIHTQSCQHLRTTALLGTKYQEVGLWARFVLCSLARDATQDAFLKATLQKLGVVSFEHLKAIMGSFVYFDNVLGACCFALWTLLDMAPTVPPQGRVEAGAGVT
ncbi:hypothetical protein LTR53_013355, partial [Teratosphaeriaceae sp. CCFEE 6253]